MDDGLFYGTPTYVMVSETIEVGGCLLVVLACLTVLRGGLAPLVAILGAMLAGGTTALTLIGDRTGRWTYSEGFWELTTYARAIGLALLALALLLALLRTRRPVDN